MSGTILDEILANKRIEVRQRRAERPVAELSEIYRQLPPSRPFTAALKERASRGESAVIAEVKKASPSKGVIRANFDPVAIARSYHAAGATCLSVLTDEKYFQGHDQYLVQVRDVVDLPVLRKDFIVDEYQIHEARALGADCVLLIVAALDIMQLTNLYQCAINLGLNVLIEVHDRNELAAAMTLQPGMIGINNRNLKTFETSLDNTIALLDDIPKDILVVTESGIHSRADVERMLDHGVYGFLVGEAFMRAPDPEEALRELFDQSAPKR
jgi:indole-3-glycerol phosphate synthase